MCRNLYNYILIYKKILVHNEKNIYIYIRNKNMFFYNFSPVNYIGSNSANSPVSGQDLEKLLAKTASFWASLEDEEEDD